MMSSFTSKFKSTFSLVILLFLFICAYEYGRMQPRTQLAQHKTTGQTQPRNHEDDPHAAAPQEETDSESEMFSNSNDDQNTASSVVDSLTLVIPKQNGSEFEKPPALDDDELQRLRLKSEPHFKELTKAAQVLTLSEHDFRVPCMNLPKVKCFPKLQKWLVLYSMYRQQCHDMIVRCKMHVIFSINWNVWKL